MDRSRTVARFMVLKVGSFVVKERVLCFTDAGFYTYDLDNKQTTNSWRYDDVDTASIVEGESDFIIYTPRHRVKKTVYRCHYRMEVLVCLMRLRSLHEARTVPSSTSSRASIAPSTSRPELQTHSFPAYKRHARGVRSPCVIEVRPDGVYQKDSDNELMSHIPFTSLVSIDVVSDDLEAIGLNHADNSSLFFVARRSDLTLAIQRVMKSYGMPLNEYRNKTLDAVCKDDTNTALADRLSFQFRVQKIVLLATAVHRRNSTNTNTNVSLTRLLAVSEQFITESIDDATATIVSSRPLSRVYSLVLFRDSPQSFQIQFIDGIRRTYSSEHCERIVAELLASCHALGNHQVDVVSTFYADWMRMLPRKIIQSEGSHVVVSTGKELGAMDRELRVVQSSILTLLATYGDGKSHRHQRQLPKGLDDSMHALALEFNANTPTSGVIVQPNKPFEKATFVVARELHDVVSRHGATHEFVPTYLQTLYRLFHAPLAMKEMMKILVEHGNDYLATIAHILSSRVSISVYWMVLVLHRLMESPTHCVQCREILLTNSTFQQKLLALFDEDAMTQQYLTELPTMMLCRLVLLLVKTNPAKHEKLSLSFYQNLATKYRMLQRILLSFPSLLTVEACVGLLSRMTNNPYFVQFGGSQLGSSRTRQVPLHSLTFGETMHFTTAANAAPTTTGRQTSLLSRRTSYNSMRRMKNVSSISSTGSTSGLTGNNTTTTNNSSGVAVKNPEVLLRQYRLFLEAPCGANKKRLEQYDEPLFLRLRYRSRNVFLQELMSHIVGSIDDCKRIYNIECYQFSGIFSTSSGQREKSEFYLTPRALIVVRTMNRQTHEFEFRSIEAVAQATSAPDAIVLTVKKKLKYLYSDQAKAIIAQLQHLAGAVGIALKAVTFDELPKQQVKVLIDQDRLDAFTWLDVQKRTGRHGSSRYRRKKVCVVDGTIREVDSTSDKSFALRTLRRVVVPRQGIENNESVVALEFSDGSRLIYVPADRDVFLGVLYDGYRFANNWNVSLGCEFSKINPRMTTRALLTDDLERYFYLHQEGLFVPSHAELTNEIDKSKDEGLAATSATDKVVFALEHMSSNIRADDFAGKTLQARVAQLSLHSILRGVSILLEQSSKPPVRVNEVAIILDAFCRVTDGCYKQVADDTTHVAAIVATLAKLIASTEPTSTLWSVNALHSLVSDRLHLAANKSAEKTTRFAVFEHKKLIQALVDVLDLHKPYCSLAVLQLFVDVLATTRASTDKTQFDAIVKALGTQYVQLMALARQSENTGLMVAAVSVLKLVVDHGDAKVRQRICDAALETGQTLADIHRAFFHPRADGRDVFQFIGAIWLVHHRASYDLLQRMLPSGFLRMLSHVATRKKIQKERDRRLGKSAHGQHHPPSKSKHDDARNSAASWFIRRMQLQVGALAASDNPSGTTPLHSKDDSNSRLNYSGESFGDLGLLADLLQKDFMLPDLIWNADARNELKAALETSLEAFANWKTTVTTGRDAQSIAALGVTNAQQLVDGPKWNHKQFRVDYECFSKEPQAGRFYLRVLYDKIKDGSLQLDEVASGLDTAAINNGQHTRPKSAATSADLFFAGVEIAKAPLVFFNDVYQCWLENLHLGRLVQYGAFSAPGGHNDSSQQLLAARNQPHDTDESCYWMLKILIEMTRVFRSVRDVGANRAKFLTQLLANSFVAAEIQDIVELMYQMSHASGATEQLCSKRTIHVFLHLSVLAHRRRMQLAFQQSVTVRPSSTAGDDDDIPLMECNGDNATSSLPIAGLSFIGATSRFNLKWSAKRLANGGRLSKNGDDNDDAEPTFGPFTVVELKDFLEKDDAVSRTAQHSVGMCVCCCSKHTMDDKMHTWRSLAEFPELRWMELPDQSIDLFESTTYALGILRNFVFNEKIASSTTSANVWPLPLTNSVLSEPASVAMLVQLLLVDDVVVHRLVCEILLSLSDTVMEKLYAYGAFFFLFATDTATKSSEENESFVFEAKLLKKIHRMQTSEARRTTQSYLLDLLPESLISLLDSDSPEVFASVYTCRTVDKRVMWSASMRAHLQQMIHEHIEDFRDELERDVGAVYSYVPIPPVSFIELSHDVYCSGYYLSTLVESATEVDAIEQPLVLMGSIEEKWRYLTRRQARGLDSLDDTGAFKAFGWNEDMVYTLADLRERYRELCTKDSSDITTVRSAFDTLSSRLGRKDEMDLGRTADEVIDCILQAQVILLEKFKFQFFSYESKTLDLLLAVLRPPMDVDGRPGPNDPNRAFRDKARRILLELVVSAPKNIALLLALEDFWEYFLDVLEFYAFGRAIDAKEDIFAVLLLILKSDEGIRSLSGTGGAGGGGAGGGLGLAPPGSHFDFGTGDEDDDVSTFFTAAEYHSQPDATKSEHAERICILVDQLMLSFENIQPWQLQRMSFEVITALCRSRDLQNQVVSITRVFWKGLYLILTSGEDVSAYRYGNTGIEQHKMEREALDAAFVAIKAIALGLHGDSRSRALDALANLLPLDFLDYLDKPSSREFCSILFSDIREPTCIWSESMRGELMQLMEEYCTDRSGDELSFLERSMNYMYDCLKDEPVIGGIYVSILLEKGRVSPASIVEYLDSAVSREFLEAIFIFLNENRDPSLGLYNDTLPALECLSVLADVDAFRVPFVECLEQHVDDPDPVNASISVATLGRYLLPFDKVAEEKGYSISSRRSLSTYGFKKKGNTDGLPAGMDAEFGNKEYLDRQELALLILNKICGFECSLEKMLVPLSQFTWSLQVITDHLGYDQAFYALSCLAELCDTCLSIAEYVERSGLWVEVLGVALQSKQHVLHENFLRAEALRGPAFEILYALFEKDFSLRQRMYSGLCRFLPYPIVYQIHLDYTKASKFFDDNHDKSDLIWNSHWRTEVRKKLDEVICRNRVERSLVKRDSVLLNDDTDFVAFPDYFVAGLYLDRFLSRPDPEALTNPAHNLELLFQLWRTKWDALVALNLQTAPDGIKVAASEVEKLTTAMTHILRAPLSIDASIANFQIPDMIVKLARHCNAHGLSGFVYQCILRVARQLLRFPEMLSREFLELLICRMTMQHPDIPALLKLVRRILEARVAAAAADSANKTEPDFLLRDIKFHSEMIQFLESLVENKLASTDTVVIGNANRILRIAKSERVRDDTVVAPTFRERTSTRWLNATLNESRRSLKKKVRDHDKRALPPILQATVNGNTIDGGGDTHGSVTAMFNVPVSAMSFDVDDERDVHSTYIGTFVVDDERDREREIDIDIDIDDREIEIDAIAAPPKSIRYDGDTLEVSEAVAPRSFRYKGNVSNPSPLQSPRMLRQSTLRANYEPEHNDYHAAKAAEYSVESDVSSHAQRGAAAAMGNAERGNPPSSGYSMLHDDAPSSSANPPSEFGSERRFSLLESWKAPSTGQSSNSSSLMSLTISRRGRRATALYSKNKSQKNPRRWFRQ